MKLSALTKRKWNYPAIAFVIPFFSIVMIMLVSGYVPFGKYSMLYSDMYHQYYPFFVSFRRALLSGQSLLYNWDVGMGMDFVGLASYYLASPLNLLSVLVPEKYLLVYFSFLVPVKLGLAALFFAIMLKKLFGQNDFALSIFGAFYGLCAWALGFQWNVMWLDTFALFPLVVLGAVYLLRDRKVVLYTVTLFLSVFTNYYVGLFTCIFIMLFFFCYEICRGKSFGWFLRDLCRIAVFSLLAIGMTAVLELPTLAALQNTQSSINQFPEGFKLNIADENTWLGLLDAMRQVAGNTGGGVEPNFKEGLPNLYCGVGMVILSFLYLTAKKVRLRDKICCVFLLLLFMLSFIIRQLDYIWHGFHFTNMIPYRFSFLFSFVVLYMAYRAWLLRDSFKLWQLIVAGILSAGVFACSDLRTDMVFLAFNAGFLLLYVLTVGYLWAYRGKKREMPALEDGQEQPEEFDENAYQQELMHRNRVVSGILIGVVALEITLNVVNFGVRFPGTAIYNYPRGTEAAASIVRYMKEREADTPFYRAEVTHTQTLNDGSLNGYHGISTFTSSANVKVTEFMVEMGFSAKNTYNRYCYEVGSPVANLFLDLKYLIERDHAPLENSYFEQVHYYEDVYLLENQAYLPLGFLVEKELAQLDLSSNASCIDFQNRFFRAASGLQDKVWNFVQNESLQITAEGAAVNVKNNLGGCSYKDATDGSAIIYTYTVPESGFMCINLDLSARNNYTVSKNGMELYSESISLPQLIAVGDVAEGDTVTVRIKQKDEEKGNITILAAILNDAVFRGGYEKLAASTWNLTSFENTRIEGTIDCDRDGLLYTSVPQDGNWSVSVDGKPADITLICDAMIGVELEQGSHTVVFSYHNAAFALGWKISLVCLAVFAAVVLLIYRTPRKQGKYERR